MRHGTANRRQRGRGNQQRRGSQQRMQVFDSNGPDVRIRGTAHQVTEKYLALAKDASSAGNVVLAESYLQHAEHYQRIINSWNLEDGVVSSDQKPQEQTAAENDYQEDDLSLPSSILGESSRATSQERTAEASA